MGAVVGVASVICVVTQSLRQALCERWREVKRGMKLEAGDKAVPWIPVVHRGDTALVDRRCNQTGATHRLTHRDLERATRAAWHAGAKTLDAIRADPTQTPTVTNRAQARPACGGSAPDRTSNRPHQSIYFAAMPLTPAELQARQLDPVAVDAALRRLLRQPAVPWLHAEVARRMAEKLPLILLKPKRLIDWWSQLGAGAELLAQAYPSAQRFKVEPGTGWIQRARQARKKPWWTAPRWVAGGDDAIDQNSAMPERIELVWANMMLHAVVDPPALIARWHEMLSVDGFVMFSCLGPGSLRELRDMFERRGWSAPTPGFVDMHDLGDMLVQAGFSDPVMDQEMLTLCWNSPAALLAELRSLGGNTAPKRFGGLRTRRWQRELERELAALAAPDGKISLSFEIAYGHAFKSRPAVRAGASTTVSLEDMRAMVRSSPSSAKIRQPLR